jgi:1,4-alpha-glucan branching enzyme
MDIVVNYRPAVRREVVALHAWEPGGRVWHVERPADDDGSFRFELHGNVADPRTVALKFQFPREKRWEDDAYLRHVPRRDAAELWAFDFTARVLTRPPGAALAADRVTFHVLTRRRYVGGQLFAWQPGEGDGDARQWSGQAGRDEAGQTSRFDVALQPWMREGFHFKLIAADGTYEPDANTRVWRPADGAEVWLKSGQVTLADRPLALTPAPIDVVFPRGLAEPPRLHIRDAFDADFDEIIEPADVTPIQGDDEFALASFAPQVYPESRYLVRADAPRAGEPPRLERPLRATAGGPRSFMVFGVAGWMPDLPQRDARVTVVVHPNPGSGFGDVLNLSATVGDAGVPALGAEARREQDRTWQADLRVFAGVPHRLELASPEGAREARPDGPFRPDRRFTVADNAPAVLHVIDGVGGVALLPAAAAWADPFNDVDQATRQRLMASTFGPAGAAGGVFDRWEMPHGTAFDGPDVWFTLRAPHAATVALLLLDPTSPATVPRQVRAVAMSLTPDLRYWWCRLPRADAPHGAHYRFQLNGREEVLDPASRWAHDPGDLWADPGDPAAAPWSRVTDPQQVAGHFQGSQWGTMGWDALLIYEIHPYRFTRRDGTGFDAIINELRPGRYLERLGVTALQVMPVHEFPRQFSWGYNPSLFFAVDSFYGGPEALARCVRAAHDAGKAVLMDVVFNHLVESPLQAVARDVYVDGETVWGDMVNYDHPACFEFFRQALLYLWHAFDLDGFRFDATEAIVNGHVQNHYIVKEDPDGSNARVGSGGGWAFLAGLKQAVRRAADAANRPWPYLSAENDPNNWGMSDRNLPGVVDGQWHFDHHYRLADAAKNEADKSVEIRDQMDWPHSSLRPFHEAVRYGESHDSVSAEQLSKQRIVRREAWGGGRRMAKAVGAAALLAKGIPMLFMGQEAGEDEPFHFGMDDLGDTRRYLRLADYEQLGNDHNRILAWFRDLIGLRNNPANLLRGDDDQSVKIGHKTVAFTRGWGRVFVIATFGTPDQRQDLGWLGLPGGGPYKEIFNSSWPAYQVQGEFQSANGGYNAQLWSGNVVNLPSIGAVVLERR